MGQAEELLNQLSGATTYADEVDYVIIGDDQVMIVPEHLKKLGVSDDNGVNTIHFVGPRYSRNGSDLSKLDIWVNFIRADDYPDRAHCKNVTVDPDDETKLHYEWEITRNVTEIHGAVIATVCAIEVDSAGYELDHWNTEICRDFYVAEGMEVDSESIINQYPDLVEYMLYRVAAVENKTTKAYILNCVEEYLTNDPSVIIEQIEKIIAEQPIQDYVNEYLDTYVDICTTESRTLEGSYAGAYEMVSMEGVSEQAQYEGKNLGDLIVTKAVTQGGVTFTPQGGDLILSGTSTEESIWMAIGNTRVEEGKYYTISCADHVAIHLWDLNNDVAYQSKTTVDEIKTFQADRTVDCRLVIENLDDNTYFPNIPLHLMFNEGDLAEPWEPYVGGKPSPSPEYEQEIKSVGTEVTVKTVNKNLWPHDSSLTFDTFKRVDVSLPAGTYTLSANVVSNDTDNDVCLVRIHNEDTNVGEAGFIKRNGRYSTTFTTKADTTSVYLYAGYKYDSSMGDTATFTDIQIEKGDTATEYVEHQESSAKITLTDELRGKNDISDVIEKRDGKWGVLRRWGKAVLDAANFAEVTWTEYEYVTFFVLPKPEDALVNGQYLTMDAMCDKFRCDTIHPLDQLASVGNVNTAASAPNLWFGYPKGTTLDEAKAAGEIEYIYQLAEPIWEELYGDAQVALENLEVYDGVTHVFVESDVQPVLTSRYGTSEYGARSITNSNKVSKYEAHVVALDQKIDDLVGEAVKQLEASHFGEIEDCLDEIIATQELYILEEEVTAAREEVIAVQEELTEANTQADSVLEVQDTYIGGDE